MTVTEVKQAMGSWELRLREETPRAILDALTFFGHIAILPGRIDPAQYGDGLLAAARYVGVYRSRDNQDERILKGCGMAFWLGDEDNKGDVFESPVTLTGASFATSINALLPPGGAVIAGTINAVAGTYTGKHQWQTPRQALTYVTDTYGAEWRVNNNATLDAGTVAQLYVTSPTALLLGKGTGTDLMRKSIAGQLSMSTDVEDTTTRVVLLAEGQGDSIATGSANAAPTPYKDIRGNPIKVTRLVSESDTETGNAAARAQLQLNRFLNPRLSVGLTSEDYDIKGTFKVGDYLDVYDPDNGFMDPGREVYWEGDRINPMALRCVEMNWPVPLGWTVAFRDINGVWIDLSRYYAPESGQTTITVGELARGLSSVTGEPLGIRPQLPSVGVDTTIPAAPVFGTFSTGNYQPTDGAWTKSAILATWTQPLNGDGSTIIDGGHYEIRFRVNAYLGYQVRWGQLAPFRWGTLSGNRWGAPISDAITSGEWHVVFVPWGQTQMLIQELTPGVEYEFQIRAVDAADPPHMGPWSASKFQLASADLFAPSQPAAPVVASSRMALQVVHTLGRAAGGTYNLEPDLAYLSVHVGGANTFLPDDNNQVGKLIANSGMITGQIPAVGTFQIEQTDGVWVKVVAVDRNGNKSVPSDGAQSTVLLIDDAHISDLTVSKITAGTITAAWILAGSIKTANTGARVEMDTDGIRAYKANGAQTFNVDGDTGFVDVTGRYKAVTDVGAEIRIDPVAGGDDPFIYLRASNAFVNRGHLAQFGTGSTDTTELSSKNLLTDAVDGGRLWLGNNFVNLMLATQAAGPDSTEIDMGATDVNIFAATGGKLNIGISQASLFMNPIASGNTNKFLLLNDGAVMSALPNGGPETYIAVGWPSTGQFSGRGKLPQAFSNSDSMFYAVGVNVGAGFGSLATTFGPTMTSSIWPLYSILGPGANFYHHISTVNLTGYTVAWSDTASHAVWGWVSRG